MIKMRVRQFWCGFFRHFGEARMQTASWMGTGHTFILWHCPLCDENWSEKR